MFLPGVFYDELATVDDGVWQGILDRHDFWRGPTVTSDARYVSAAFHVLVMNDLLASRHEGVVIHTEEELNAVQVPDAVFDDPIVRDAVASWANMHEHNCGAGYTIRSGICTIRAGENFGYRIDGSGSDADLSDPLLQESIIRVHASRCTVLPLRFSDSDEFLICGRRIPLRRGKFFELSNVLPHAFVNRGADDAALLMTTYLVTEAVPQQSNTANDSDDSSLVG